MARSRNLKPSFFQNEDLAQCGPLAMLLFEGLWCHADREGRLEYRPSRIKIQVLPYFDADVVELLACLEKMRFIHTYEVDGRKYIQVVSFTKHQNPHMKETHSTIPAPDSHQTSTGNSVSSPADSLNPLPLTLNPITKDAKASSAFKKPTHVEVKAYCYERGNTVDHEAFISFYDSNGWKVGKNKMKDWKAAVITWEKRSKNGGHNGKDQRTRAKRVSDRLDDIARRDIEQNGHTDKLG